MAAATRRKAARLTFEDGEVMVVPPDQDIFFLSAEKATEACKHAVQVQERVGRFKAEILVPLYKWCVAHSDRVRACYIPVPGVNIKIFIVTSSPAFDFDLAHEIAALEMDLAKAGWYVAVSQLPNADEETMETFFSKEGALEFYAQREPAPEESRK